MFLDLNVEQAQGWQICGPQEAGVMCTARTTKDNIGVSILLPER